MSSYGEKGAPLLEEENGRLLTASVDTAGLGWSDLNVEDKQGAYGGAALQMVPENKEDKGDVASGPPPMYCGGRITRKQAIIACMVVTVGFTTICLVVGILVGGGAIAEASIGVAEVNVDSFSITAYAEDGSTFTADIDGRLENRVPLPTYLKSTTFDMKFDGQLFGKLDFPAMKLKGSNVKRFSLNQTVVRVTDLEAFTAFNSKLLQDEEAVVQFYSTSLALRAVGITFENVKMDKDIRMAGINNFETFPLELSNIDAVGVTRELTPAGDEADVILLEMDASLFNPSPVEFADLGRMRLQIEFEGVTIGFGESAFFNQGLRTPLEMGENKYEFEGRIIRDPADPAVGAAITSLMSNYASGIDSSITLVGSLESTDIALIQGALATLRSQTILPGLSQEDLLIRYAAATMPLDIQWNSADFYTYEDVCADTENNIGIEASIMLRNPFSTAVHIESGTLSVAFQDFPNYELFFDQLYMFNAPYDQEENIGFVDIQERITMEANIEDPATSAYVNGITPITQIMCLDGIMDCGCKYLPGNEFMTASGCPAVSLIDWLENQLGCGSPEVFPNSPRLDKAGTPGNGVSRVEGGVVVSIGNCLLDDNGDPVDEDPDNGLFCFKNLPLTLTQSHVNLAISLDSYVNDNELLCI